MEDRDIVTLYWQRDQEAIRQTHQQGHRRKEYQPAAQTHAVIGVHFPEAIRCLSSAPSFPGGTPLFHKKHHGGDQCQPRGEHQKLLIHRISPYIFVFFHWEA